MLATALLLLSTLGGLPPDAGIEPVPETPIERHHAIWVQPVLTVAFLAVPPQTFFLEAPVPYAFGGQLNIWKSVSLSLDWSYVYASTSNDNISSPGWLMTGSLGLIIPIWGPGPLKGFFVQPRIAFGGGKAWGTRCGPICDATTPLFEVMAVIDAGFQWHYRRLFAALAIGIGGGICTGCAANNAFLTVTGGYIGRPSFGGFAWGVDLNVLRIGVAL